MIIEVAYGLLSGSKIVKDKNKEKIMSFSTGG